MAGEDDGAPAPGHLRMTDILYVSHDVESGANEHEQIEATLYEGMESVKKGLKIMAQQRRFSTIL